VMKADTMAMSMGTVPIAGGPRSLFFSDLVLQQ
jgi:hypothetical protein